jgi:hypothetical protein
MTLLLLFASYSFFCTARISNLGTDRLLRRVFT